MILLTTSACHTREGRPNVEHFRECRKQRNSTWEARAYASDSQWAPKPAHNFAWGGADGRTLDHTAHTTWSRLPLWVEGPHE
jgi:hypothetical protein